MRTATAPTSQPHSPTIPAWRGAANPTSFTVTSPATVTATKTVTGTFNPGGAVTYTVVLTNAGPSAQADNPGNELTDVLPASLTLVSATASSGTAVATVGTNTVTWDGSLANGASVTITISATIAASTAPGTAVANQGTVSFDADGNGTNESTALTDDPGVSGTADPTTFTTSTEPTLTATKTVTGRFTLGGTITYTIVVSNSGSLPQADNAGDELTDVLPASLTLVSASTTSGTAVATTATNTVTWNGSLAAGGSTTITIAATIAASTVAGTAVTNQGTISFDADGDGTNESSALTDDPATPTAGDATSFTVVTPVPFIDLNGDGLGDVVLYNVATGAGSSQVNDGSGGFTATAETWDAGWKVFPLNLNDDAYTDIFFYHPVNGFWVQALNTGVRRLHLHGRQLGPGVDGLPGRPRRRRPHRPVPLQRVDRRVGQEFRRRHGRVRQLRGRDLGSGVDVYAGGPEWRRPRRLLPLQPEHGGVGEGGESGGRRHLRLPGEWAVGSRLADLPRRM